MAVEHTPSPPLDPPPRHPGQDLLHSEERFRLLVEQVQDYAIFMLDTEGRVISWNAGARRIKGYTAGEIIGQHFSRFYQPEAVARRFPEEELRIATAEGRFEDTGWRVRKDGTLFWANVVITALRDSMGVLRGFAKVTRDLTDRRRDEERLRQSEERFRLLVEQVKEYAIFMLDPEGIVISWNTGAERIKGYTAGEIVGQHFSCFYTPSALADGCPEKDLKRALAEDGLESEGWHVRKDGTLFWANAVITPLYDKARILQGFAKVTRDMTERKRIEDLESASRQTHEFLAMLAHELRNPLAPIRNALALMTSESDVSTKNWAQAVIARQVSHLTRLVDDLLDVSRVTNGTITLQRERVDLAAVTARALESCRPLMEARRQELQVEIAKDQVWVEGDLVRLSQVLINLLNNAAKYTPEGGKINLSISRNNDDAVIRVRDTGIGIPADLLPNVFDIFRQGNRSLDRSEGGLGIGLTLVQRLVVLHGGSVEARSEGAGRGSEFIVKLPQIQRRKSIGGQSAGSESEPREVTAGRRIMVVDDNEDSADTIAILLQLWGHQVRTVHDGSSAISLVAEFRPEIVLLDIGLPGMNGYEVAKRLREIPGFEKVVLMAMTGYGQEADRRRAFEEGFDRHLMKPLDPAELRRTIETAAKKLILRGHGEVAFRRTRSI